MADARSSELVSGADPDGVVTMTVTVDVGRVVDVVVRADWRRVIASGDLAGAVLRAFHSAQAAAVAWQFEHPAAPPTPEAVVGAPEYVRDLVHTVLDQLGDYVTRVARVSSVRFEVAGPARAVTVVSSGGQVNAVTVEGGWARRVPAADLAGEIRSAFAAAQARITTLAAEVGGPTREMAELTALAADPVRFVGLIGMRGGEADGS